MIRRVKTTSLSQTRALASRLAPNFIGGEVVELSGDLGGGKTALVKALVTAWAGPQPASSPSFTIENIYQTPNFNVHHFDFYRLSEPGIMSYELAEVVGQPKIVTLVEWSQIVDDVLPSSRLTIKIEFLPHPQARSWNFNAPKGLEYLLEGV